MTPPGSNAGLGVVIVLGVISALAITRMITTPVKGVVRMLRDVAEGEGDLTQRLDIRSHDEIGELATWFNRFIENVHEIIKQVSAATQEVAGASTEIAAASEEMSQGLRDQAKQASQVSSAVEEMSSTVIEVAKKSADAAGTAQGAGQRAQEGGKVVTQTVDGINAATSQVSLPPP